MYPERRNVLENRVKKRSILFLKRGLTMKPDFCIVVCFTKERSVFVAMKPDSRIVVCVTEEPTSLIECVLNNTQVPLF